MPVRFLSFSNDSVLCADAVRSYTKNRLVRTLSPSINLFVGDYAASNRIEDLADQSEGIRRVVLLLAFSSHTFLIVAEIIVFVL